ncbi:MAG: hypothetical protein QGF90_12945 [Gammaproteobacteria bacterium]|jgi:hypothetical protein|nr:hypothetical protein [Gammaproteobacteria bacterium]|tara:strand:- start:6081 stop:6332 length:252 start_codon:yes stop_codon:yes gene_type:complete
MNGWTQKVLAVVAVITVIGVSVSAFVGSVSFVSAAVIEERLKPLEHRLYVVENAVTRNDEAHKALNDRLDAIDATLKEMRDKL